MAWLKPVFEDFSRAPLDEIEKRGLAWTTDIQAPVDRNATAAEIEAYENLAHAAYTLRKRKMEKPARQANAKKLCEQPTDDLANFCGMLKEELGPLIEKLSRGRYDYDTTFLLGRLKTIFNKLYWWIDERFPVEGEGGST